MISREEDNWLLTAKVCRVDGTESDARGSISSDRFGNNMNALVFEKLFGFHYMPFPGYEHDLVFGCQTFYAVVSFEYQRFFTGDIEKLLSSGWKLAGFASAGTNRYALILFKHSERNYLVQCLTGYDVTRKKREVTTCYEIR